MKKPILLIFALFLVFTITKAQETEKPADPTGEKELKPALLVIDVQNAFMPMMDKSDMDLAIQHINWSIWLFEKFQLPIIRIYHQDKNGNPEKNTEGFEFSSEINIKEEYPMIIKNYGNAFNKTDLDKMLKEKGINTVFLCGLSATGCVLATNIGANDYDYKSFLIKNALLSPDANQTDFVEDIMSTIDLETIMFMFEYL